MRIAKGVLNFLWHLGNVAIAYLGYKLKPIPGRIDTGLVFVFVMGGVCIATPSLIDLCLLIVRWLTEKQP